MHDPLVVAFEIRRPWPRRERSHDSIRPHTNRVFPRWRFKLHHDCAACDEQERAEHAGKRYFPWWKPASWTPFWTIAGCGYYWSPLITIWHREPRGHDSGEVCKHYIRWQDENGKWQSKILHGWRFHVHHWKIQVSPLQELRRRLLTRCAWCGGRSRKRDSVNHSLSWDGPRGRWWQGEPGLYHGDCASIYGAHAACLCESPVLDHGGYGRCARCSGFRRFGATADELDRQRLLAAISDGARDREVYRQVCEMAKGQR
jgi:hypothetical protein